MGRWRAQKAAVALAWVGLTLAAAAPGAAADRPGLALREALAESAAGDAANAAAHFEAIARRWPVIGDHAERLAAENWLAAGDATRALQAAQRIVRNHPGTPLTSAAARLEAEAEVAQGDLAAALDAYERAHGSAKTTEERRALRAAWAQTAEAAGRPTVAYQHWLVIWRQVPGTPEDERAVAALARLEASGLPAPNAVDWAARAEALAEANDPAGSIHAFDRALAAEIPDRTRRHLTRGRAFALFRAREYEKAFEAFDALGPDSEARLYRARSLARAGDRSAAIEAFEEIGRSRSSQRHRARYLVATLLDDDPETLPRAIEHYEAVAEGSALGRERRAAAWRLAWLARTRGELEEAAQRFERLATGDPIAALQPRYWAARTRADLDPAASGPRGEFAEMARRYPLTYYGWRSKRLAGPAATGTPQPAKLPLGQQRLGGAPVERVRILIEADLTDEAGEETIRLESRARTLADRLLLADLALATERPDRAQALALLGNEEALARGVAPNRQAVWAYAWPRPWQTDVEASAARAGIEPALVWAVMREESSFRSAVVSPAGAHGLLQLMPETAERLEAELGSPGPIPRVLHEPAVNIRFGSHLLGKLNVEFPTRPSAAIGAYNAGAGPVSRWLAEAPGMPDDEWVESIPYDETRAYVQRVLRSVHAYRAIY